jgi:hypothetical protein
VISQHPGWLALFACAACSRPAPPPAPSDTAPTSGAPLASAASPTSSGPIRTGNVSDLGRLGLEKARRRIVAVTTALKPGGPSEVIEINEGLTGATLRARRLYPDDTVDSETATLSSDDFTRLWKVVQSEGLTHLEPPQTDPAVMDGAGHMMVLEWPEAGRIHVHALHWSNPREPHPGIDHLFRDMAELSRRKAPAVKLHYFP